MSKLIVTNDNGAIVVDRRMDDSTALLLEQFVLLHGMILNGQGPIVATKTMQEWKEALTFEVMNLDPNTMTADTAHRLRIIAGMAFMALQFNPIQT